MAIAWPFVGREEVTAQAAAAIVRHGQPVAVTGPVGSGRTRFVRELATLLHRRHGIGARVLDGPTWAVPTGHRGLVVVDGRQGAHHPASARAAPADAPDRGETIVRIAPGSDGHDTALAALGDDWHVVRLRGLDTGGVRTMLEGGLRATVATGAVRLLHDQTCGLPGLVAALVDGDRTAVAYDEDLDVWHAASLRPGTRTDVVLEQALAGTPEAARWVMAVLGVTGALDIALLYDLVTPADVAAAERADLVRACRSGRRHRIAASVPVLGTAAARRTGGRVRRELAAEAGRALASTPMRRRGDLARAALWELTATGSLDPRHAAAAADDAADPDDARRLAAAAGVDHAPAVPTLARALRRQGRRTEARRVLGAAETTRDATRDATRSRADDPVVAVRTDRAAGRGQTQLEAASRTLATGRVEAAVRQLDAMADAWMPPAVAPWRDAVTAVAGVLAGRWDLAADHAIDDGPSIARSARAFALCEHGDPAEADAVAAVEYDLAFHAGRRELLAWAALQRARAALQAGAARDALRHAAEAAVEFRTLELAGPHRWATSVLATASAWLGGPAGRLGQLDRLLAADVGAPLFDTEVLRARGWVAAATGDATRATTLWATAAAVARDTGQATIEAAALHDHVRTSADPAVAERLAALADLLSSPRARVAAAHARALAAGAPHRLLRVAQELEDLGHWLVAAEATAAAADLHAEQGQVATAAEARRTVARRLVPCQGARTPRLQATPALATLTPREREVAGLAATGRANRAIADGLHLSVRTVENHLQRVYTKLGIHSRDELGQTLGAPAV